MICEVCHKEFFKRSYGGEYQDVCSSECFHRKFWQGIVEYKDDYIVIGYECYYIGDEHSTSSFRGHSGRKFRLLELRTDKIIETTNLWYKGSIPEEFRPLLPPTHAFYLGGLNS